MALWRLMLLSDAAAKSLTVLLVTAARSELVQTGYRNGTTRVLFLTTPGDLDLHLEHESGAASRTVAVN